MWEPAKSHPDKKFVEATRAGHDLWARGHVCKEDNDDGEDFYYEVLARWKEGLGLAIFVEGLDCKLMNF